MFSQYFKQLSESYEGFCENKAEELLIEMVNGSKDLNFKNLKKVVKHMYWDLSLQCNEHGCYFIQDDIQKKPIYSAPIGSLERVAQWMFDGVLECRKAKEANHLTSVTA